MKIFMQVSAVLFLLFSVQNHLQAQALSKDEAKKWKNAAKEYKRNPAQLKALTEERDLYREQAGQLEQKVGSAEAALAQEKTRSADMEQQIARLNNNLLVTQQAYQELQQRQAAVEAQPSRPPATSAGGTYSGPIFRIQVGAFKKGALPSKFDKYDDMYLEEEGNLQKVLLGEYRNYDDAKVRLSQLKKEGFSGAWIVPFKGGQRVPLKEALNQ